MKQLLALFLALTLCLSLAACGGGEDTPTTGPQETVSAMQDMPITTSVPETTTEAAPTYEAIEINADNFWQYFELVEDVYWEEDDFGDLTGAVIGHILTIKETYANLLDPECSELAVEFNLVQNRSEISVDWDNRTYTIGDTLDTKAITRTANFHKGFAGETELFEGTNWNSTLHNDWHTKDASTIQFISTDRADLEILRVQGTIYLQTNE